MIRFLVLALLAVPFLVNAGTSDLAFVFDDSGQIRSVVRGSLPGTFSTSLNLGSVTASTSGNFAVNGSAVISGPAGALPVSAVRTVSGLGAARAIVAQAAKGFTPVAIGLGAYDLMQAYRMRSTAGQLEIDQGASTVDKAIVSCTLTSGPAHKATGGSFSACYSSAIEVANNYWLADEIAVNNSNYATKTTITISPKTCTSTSYCQTDTTSVSWTRSVSCTAGICTKGAWIRGSTSLSNAPVSGTSTITKACPDITDPLTGQSYTPGVSGDGKCITGRYDPITEEQAAAKLATAITAKAVEDYIRSPPSKDSPIPSSAPMVITGPATQNGPPQTTTRTGPSGTVSETVTKIFQYNYAGDTITYNTVNQTVTNITTPEGVTTTETELKPEEPRQGDCELYPNSVGCLELGELPEGEVPEQEREVDIEPEDIDLPSGCPADVAIPGGRVLSYAAACAAAEDVAPLVIAAGVLSALLIAVAAIRGG